jgi:hypothetical protein
MWVVSVTPRPRFTPGERTPVPIVQEAGWASEPVWTQRIEEISFALLQKRNDNTLDCVEYSRSGVLKIFSWLTIYGIENIHCNNNNYFTHGHTVLPAIVPTFLCTAAIRKIIVTLFVIRTIFWRHELIVCTCARGKCVWSLFVFFISLSFAFFPLGSSCAT